MRRALLVAGAASLVLASAGAAYGAWIYLKLVTPVSPAAEARAFEVREGEPLQSVFARLEREGLLADRSAARWLARYGRLAGLDRRVRRGEYELAASQSPLELLRTLVEGEAKLHAVTLPEGLRLDEVAERLAAAGIAPAAELLRLARDPELVDSLGLGETGADSLEGYLYPETYHFERGSAPRRVLARMLEEFHGRWGSADRERLAASGRSLHEVVTLASIVEKETGVPSERPRIASVFHNRLRLGMRLQSDPTVIYGILVTRGSFDGNLRRRDLEEDTPYNTYTRRGIPPGPIANPGMEAIRAVLEPEESSYLYFVSRNDGTHVFNARHRDHVAAVNRYQRR